MDSGGADNGNGSSVIKLIDNSLLLLGDGSKLNIGTKDLEAIKSGRQSLVVRFGYPFYMVHKKGTRIELVASRSSIFAWVEDIRVYSNLWEVVKNESWQRIVPELDCMEDAYAALMHQNPPFKGMPDIHVFELEPIKVQIG